MPETLPALRLGLDLMPSPLPDRPGLLLRDPLKYSESVLVLPSPLVPLLAFFDGRRTEAELREALLRMTGEVRVGELIAHLRDSLSRAGFLEDHVAAAMRDARQQAFAAADRRDACHAGSAYPGDAEPLRRTLQGYLDASEAPAPTAPLRGIAAPHVSPEGGSAAYRAAYRALPADLADRTFVVLGTSHYGEPEKFGLTRKPFVTPLGEAAVDRESVDRLWSQGGSAVQMEDYCHSIEHSIEFQVVFLQHLYGPTVRILPILCGPFAKATLTRGRPEDDPGVAGFLGALADLAARGGAGLFWVLGVDMSHVGRRYGDAFRARAGFGKTAAVERQDRERIGRLTAADPRGFWSLLQEGGDALRWCGASPLYTFLTAVGPARGELLRYEQWNIDEASVVSFAALAFS